MQVNEALTCQVCPRPFCCHCGIVKSGAAEASYAASLPFMGDRPGDLEAGE